MTSVDTIMNPDLPSFSSVCATIQMEETCRKIMTVELKVNIPKARVYLSNHRTGDERGYKGKKLIVKCSYCDTGGYT